MSTHTTLPEQSENDRPNAKSWVIAFVALFVLNIVFPAFVGQLLQVIR